MAHGAEKIMFYWSIGLTGQLFIFRGLFLEDITRQVKLVNDITKCISENKCLLAMRFYWIGLVSFRVIKLWMSAFASYVNDAILFKNSYDFSQFQWFRHSLFGQVTVPYSCMESTVTIS